MTAGTPRTAPRILGMFAAGLMVATALTAAVSVLPSTAVHAQQQLHATAIDPTRGFADLVDVVMPAVVSVQVKFSNAAATEGGNDGQQQMQPGSPEDSPFRDFFKQFPQFRQGPGQGQPDDGPKRGGMAQGSGFIISADGYAVTNNHVVKDADEVSVTMKDGTEYQAEVIGTDPKTDLALIKIKSAKAFDFVSFTRQEPRVGDWVMAVGNPFGLGGSVTTGIISARGRDIGSGPYDDFLQIDAAINRGNSGGPAFNLEGEVVGINTAIFSPSGGSVGIGFAIPASIAENVIASLKESGAVTRGWLGVQIQPVTEDLADSLGLPRNRGEFIQTVQPGKAAATAGIQPGDVVVKIDGKDVTPEQTLSYIVANIAPGKRIPIELMRDGKRMTLNAVVGKRPTDDELAASGLGAGQQGEEDPFAEPPAKAGEGLIERVLGLSVLPLTPQIARQIRVPAETQGLVIRAVDGSSDAGTKGLQKGDVILSAANRPVLTPADLEAAVRAAQTGSRPALLLRVQRGNQAAGYVPIRLR